MATIDDVVTAFEQLQNDVSTALSDLKDQVATLQAEITDPATAQKAADLVAGIDSLDQTVKAADPGAPPPAAA